MSFWLQNLFILAQKTLVSQTTLFMTSLWPWIAKIQVDNYDELNDSICKAIDYYINEDPQKRFNGLTAGEMRKEAMKGNIKNCPIAPNHRIERYWQEINEKKVKEAKKILS